MPKNIFIFLLKKIIYLFGNVYVWAGKFNRVARDEACVGSKLVYNWGAFEGTIFSEVNYTINRKNSVCKRSHSKELGS